MTCFNGDLKTYDVTFRFGYEKTKTQTYRVQSRNFINAIFLATNMFTQEHQSIDCEGGEYAYVKFWTKEIESVKQVIETT